MATARITPDGFRLTDEGQKIEVLLPEANCNKCSHFKTCAMWRTTAQIEQNGLPIKLTEFFKTLPRICPEYDISAPKEDLNSSMYGV